MKGLSFSQPWLWAVHDPIADKNIENRSWAAAMDMIEVPFATHAAKSFDDDGMHQILSMGHAHMPTELPKRAITGVATIDRIVTSPKTLTPAQRRWYQGDDDGMRDGKVVYGHVLKDRRPLSTPIPWDGALGFWEVPLLVHVEIFYQLDGVPVLHPFSAAAGALRDYNGATVHDKLVRFVEINPGQHVWITGGDLHHANLNARRTCFACGHFEPKATAKKRPPCRGILPLTVRAAAAELLRGAT